MPNPQVENGHIKIANEIAEALARIQLSARESQLLWVVLRKTYGWNKKSDAISLTQFSEATGIDNANIAHILTRMVNRNILKREIRSLKNMTVYTLQKDYSTWVDSVNSDTMSKQTLCQNKQSDSVNSDNQIVSILTDTKDTITKDTITKDTTTLYGEGQNVKLSDNDYKKLTERYGEKKVLDGIENLSAYLANNPKKKYASHYLTINNWLRRDGDKPSFKKSTIRKAFDTTDELKRRMGITD